MAVLIFCLVFIPATLLAFETLLKASVNHAVSAVTYLVANALGALGKAILKEAVSWSGAKNELRELEKTMRLIKARVQDAEKRQEADGGEAIKEWLQRLKLVLYQADDLFDEVLTLDRQKQQRKSRMFGKVDIIKNSKLANEIKSIKKELDAIKSDMSGLNLRDLPADELPMLRSKENRETASFLNIEDVIGRDTDINNIINMLFHPKYDHERVTVIPIVGFGGLGKTTLVQWVLHDGRVKNDFDLIKWAHVPEMDDLIIIKRKLYMSFTDKSYNGLSLDQIERGIRNSIEAKKYLLVLDDLWDEGRDRLNNLVNLLKCGKQGSKVIVTTRSSVVARVVGTIIAPYNLGTLTPDQSWDLFKRLALKQGKEEDNNPFTEIGKEIVNMCGNVPLAIKVVAGFLAYKDREKEWLQARDAQCSKAQLTKGHDIMDVLKLSYDYLPPALKLCFAYCSLFPKGYRFDNDDLVYMWMAQGYFEPSNGDTGDIHFMTLLAKGFFQDPEFSADGNVKSCKMHDLFHDLAQHVAGEESVLWNDESSIQITHRLLHVNLNTFLSQARPSLFFAGRMRSLLLSLTWYSNEFEGLISRLQHLRTLKVEGSSIDKLPNAIGRLMHLRYLYIQSNEIEYLPDSITRLENLQTLNVQHCEKLKELPSDFAKLTNIRHLLLPDELSAKWRDLPGEFGKLTSLKVLNRYIVGENNGIDSLPILNYREKLVIQFCKWRRNDILEVQRANLKHCDQLTSLVLWFDEDVTPPFDEMNEMLMNLQLSPNLRHLKVKGYKGDKMPSRWLDGLSKLVSIRIERCLNCKVVPQFSQLPNLKKVKIVGLEDLKMDETAAEEEGNTNSNFRNSSTGTQRQCLTSLRELTLFEISKMKKLPSGITCLTTLEKLQIHNLKNLIELPEEIGNNSLLCQLYIGTCPKLESLPTSVQDLTSLQTLTIKKCHKLESLPTSLLSLTSLEILTIEECPNLEERYKPDGDDCHLIQHIPHVFM